MHILHVISSYGAAFVGNEIHGELGKAIIARGHRYSILTLAPHNTARGMHIWHDDAICVYEMAQGRGVAARLEGAISTRIFHYQPFLFALRWFGNTVRSHLHDVDLVLVEGGYPLGAIAAVWQPIVRKPLCIVLQGGDMHRQTSENYGFGRYATARWLLRLAVRRAAVMRAYSPLGCEAAIERGADPARVYAVAQNIGTVCYLPPDVNVDTFRHEARAHITARHQLHGKYLLIAVGRLLPIKGFDGLIRVLPDIEALTGARVELLMCGPGRTTAAHGDYRAYLEQLAQHVGVADRVYWTGEVSHTHVREYLAAADVLCIPSVMEGGAKVLMEGAAVGTPFVATETAGTPAFLPEGGLTVPPIHVAPTTFPRAVAVLLCNDELRRTMGQRAVARASWFNAEHRADELLPLYEKAIAAHK